MTSANQAENCQAVTRLLVTYNSNAVLEYSAQPVDKLSTMIVDNASSDDTISTAKSLGYTIVTKESNSGYSTAIMTGLERIESEFTLISNPDLKMSLESVSKLVDAARRYPECDVFVPRIFRPDGSEFFRFETRFDRRVKDRTPPMGDACIDTLSGAALLVRTRPFFKNGGFDKNIFLYFEDDELSLRYRQQQRPMIFVADAHSTHIGDASSGDDVSISRIKNVSFGWSWAYLMKRMSLGNRWMALLSMTGKLALYFISGRRRKLLRQWGILEGFVRNLAGQPAPYHPDSRR